MNKLFKYNLITKTKKDLIKFILDCFNHEQIDKELGITKDSIEDLEKYYRENKLQNLFYFKILLTYKCKKCKHKHHQTYTEFYLENDNEVIENINDLLNSFKKKSVPCIECNNDIIAKRTIVDCSQYLTTIINNNKDSYFKLDEIIDIKDYCDKTKYTKYELVSFLYSDSLLFSKSSENRKWHNNEGEILQGINEYFNNKMKAPEFLIYKLINKWNIK